MKKEAGVCDWYSERGMKFEAVGAVCVTSMIAVERGGGLRLETGGFKVLVGVVFFLGGCGLWFFL